jgi:hypothetical protein
MARVIRHRVNYAECAHRARYYGQHDLAARYDAMERERHAAIGTPIKRVIYGNEPGQFVYILNKLLNDGEQRAVTPASMPSHDADVLQLAAMHRRHEREWCELNRRHEGEHRELVGIDAWPGRLRAALLFAGGIVHSRRATGSQPRSDDQ